MSATLLTYAGPSKFGLLLNVSDAATRVGLTETHLRRIIRRGELTVARHPSGRLLGIYEAHIAEWQDARLAQRATGSVRSAGIGVDARMQALMKSMGIASNR